MKNVLIFGATSAIAQATARCFAEEGSAFFLVARNADRLRSVADDLHVRGASKVITQVMDALEYERHGEVIDAAALALGNIDLAILAHGTLPNQRDCEHSFDVSREALDVNCLSMISLLTHLANHFEAVNGGTILVLSSVAGDRGRQSNYVYGSAKGAVTIFLQGMRNRLHAAGVYVATVKLGMVDTPMTAEFNKGLLWSSPERVGRSIHRIAALGGGEFYVPWFWRYIMFIIRRVPENLFKKMRL